MQKIDTVFCLSASSELYGKWIRRITKSPVNHSFMLFRHPEFSGDRWWAIQVAGHGVVVEPAKFVIEDDRLIHLECYQCRTADLWKGVESNFDAFGADYDWSGIFGFLVMIEVKRLLGLRIPNLYHGSGKYFCSEFTASILKRSELPWAKCLIPSTVSPANLREMIRPRLGLEWAQVPSPIHTVVDAFKPI